MDDFLKIILNPGIAVKHLWRRCSFGNFALREQFDAFHKPSYAYGMLRAAMLAKSLKIPEISSIEFGVASGDGLIDMEKISVEIFHVTGIQIRVYGFDTGCGLTEVTDFRDMPYLWKTGQYPMDFEKLKRKLKSTKLIMGDIANTMNKFYSSYSPPPIGFVSFDLDLYSSTKIALDVFEVTHEQLLPRVYCYFDDVAGENADCNHFTGELLAIDEFNTDHRDRKLAKIEGLAFHRPIKSSWNDAMYVLHDFQHPLYGIYIPHG